MVTDGSLRCNWKNEFWEFFYY